MMVSITNVLDLVRNGNVTLSKITTEIKIIKRESVKTQLECLAARRLMQSMFLLSLLLTMFISSLTFLRGCLRVFFQIMV